ncbi:helix-turn-helix domain-containing protein [Nocardia sp. NBC_01499]|uniref:helix-turn-helix domain-containing protein n=1 Tax=Nocardia sp. NBC_01499 TaxID=2903597 RepID=UPI00386CD329
MDKVELDTEYPEAWQDLPLLLAVPRAAKLMGISRSAGYRLAHAGELPIKPLGGRIYVITARLREMMEAA